MCQYACFRKMIGCRGNAQVRGVVYFAECVPLSSLSETRCGWAIELFTTDLCLFPFLQHLLAAPAFFCLWNIPQQGWNGAGHWRHESPRTTGGMHHQQTYLWLLKGMHYVLSFYACVLNRLDGHVSQCIMSRARKCNERMPLLSSLKRSSEWKEHQRNCFNAYWFM